MMVLRRVQLAELEILNEVARICNQHEITYFLLEGTLLGSVRHNGFIPWDDDVDIGMMREDYEKFLSVCQTELSNRFSVQWHENEPLYYLPFAKIRMKNTIYIEHEVSERFKEHGFWVDIFPLDYIGNPTKLLAKMRGFACKTLYSLSVVLSLGGKSGIQKIAISILKMFHINNRTLMRLHNRCAGKGKGDFIVNHGSAYGFLKQTVPADWYFPPRKTAFEGKTFTIPNKSEKLLERIYGDYMRLPPEEKRIARHSALKVQFEDGSTAESLQEDIG